MSEEKKPGLLPGMAAIGIWMMVLALIGLIGVTRHQQPPVVLILSAAFALAGQGLFSRRRWGWAMTLAAVLLSALYAVWAAVRFRQPAELGLSILNLLFFLYLVRPEVRATLRSRIRDGNNPH